MALVLTSGPGTEPVSLAEVKAHLRLDGTAEDALLASLILTSRLHIESALGLALISHDWSLKIDAWPSDRVVIAPIRPLQEVTAIRVTGRGNSISELPLRECSHRSGTSFPRIVLAGPVALPQPGSAVNSIEIAFRAGFGDTPSSVPAPIRHALLLLVSHWYEHRDPIEIGTAEARIPAAVSALLEPFAVKRL